MTRLQRLLLIVLIPLAAPGLLWAANFEMLTISTTAVGPNTTTCQVGATQQSAIVFILDQPVWYTIHSRTATPGPTLGALGAAGTVIKVDFANEFRAVRSGGTDARAYIVCTTP